MLRLNYAARMKCLRLKLRLAFFRDKRDESNRIEVTKFSHYRVIIFQLSDISFVDESIIHGSLSFVVIFNKYFRDKL